MKTTKIFMMAALALMMTACSNDDNDQTAPKPNADGEITVTAKINVNDGSALTRAVADNGTTITSGLAVDEQIAVLFSDGTDNLKRTATVKSIAAGTATIEFTIPSTLVNNTACTLVYPATAAKADNTDVDTYANLLSAQTGALGASLDVRKGTATILNDGETASLSGTPSLAAQFAIFKLTLGSAIDATHPLVIKDNADNTIVTVTPTSSTTTVYVAMEPATAKYFKFSATTAESKIISKSNTATIAAGNYYQATLAVPALGDLYYTDGTYSTTLQDGKTPIGVIAYLGTDNFTENGTNVGGSTFVGHGLVLCLKNAASAVCWSTEKVSKFSGQEVTDADGLKRTENVSGYTNTATLTVDDATAAKYPAAAAAKNYTTLTAPASTTGWFLPSAQQWVKMQEGLGELDESAITWLSWYDNSHTAVDKWEAAFVKAGAGNYDSMTSAYLWYWFSSEYSADHAVGLGVDATGTGSGGYGFYWVDGNKDSSSTVNHVRPVLAF